MLGFTQVLGAFTRLTPEQRHFISIDGSIGYASLFSDSVGIQPGAGTAINIGVGYRLFHNNFLFSVGAEGYYMLNAYSMSDVNLTTDMIDTEGMPFRMIANVTDGRDLCHFFSVNIPILFGMEYRRFYFLAGPKIAYNIRSMGQANAEGILTTKGDYERYIGEFENMPNHFFSTEKIQSSAPEVSWNEQNLDILAHIEIGGRLGEVSFQTGADVPNPQRRYYLAFYLDYGLRNIRTSAPAHSRLECQQSSSDQAPQYVLTPAIMSTNLGSSAIHQYSFGIKATVLFELPQKKPCVFCKDNWARKYNRGKLQGRHVKKD